MGKPKRKTQKTRERVVAKKTGIIKTLNGTYRDSAIYPLFRGTLYDGKKCSLNFSINSEERTLSVFIDGQEESALFKLLLKTIGDDGSELSQLIENTSAQIECIVISDEDVAIKEAHIQIVTYFESEDMVQMHSYLEEDGATQCVFEKKYLIPEDLKKINNPSVKSVSSCSNDIIQTYITIRSGEEVVVNTWRHGVCDNRLDTKNSQHSTEISKTGNENELITSSCSKLNTPPYSSGVLSYITRFDEDFKEKCEESKEKEFQLAFYLNDLGNARQCVTLNPHFLLGATTAKIFTAALDMCGNGIINTTPEYNNQEIRHSETKTLFAWSEEDFKNKNFAFFNCKEEVVNEQGEIELVLELGIERDNKTTNIIALYNKKLDTIRLVSKKTITDFETREKAAPGNLCIENVTITEIQTTGIDEATTNEVYFTTDSQITTYGVYPTTDNQITATGFTPAPPDAANPKAIVGVIFLVYIFVSIAVLGIGCVLKKIRKTNNGVSHSEHLGSIRGCENGYNGGVEGLVNTSSDDVLGDGDEYIELFNINNRELTNDSSHGHRTTEPRKSTNDSSYGHRTTGPILLDMITEGAQCQAEGATRVNDTSV